jgi:peptidoglycan/xylan/chitin deacetylase (PgdA/CDA1 family)
MAVNNVNYNDTLREGTDKINQSIDQSNEAITKANSADSKADNAVNTANQANTKSDDTQQQLNNIVINNGESDAEVLQARGNYSVLNERLEAADTQLAENETKLFHNSIVNHKSKKPLMVMIDDDLKPPVYTLLKPVIEQEQVPMTCAVITGRVGTSDSLSLTQMKELEGIGFNFTSHTVTHPHLADLTTEQEIEIELRDSSQWLKNNGFKNFNTAIVYPYGSEDERVRRIARKYYKAGVLAGTEKLNYPPLKTYQIDRVYYNTMEGVNQISHVKQKIDEAIANGNLLILGMHCFYNGFSSSGLIEVIQYAKQQGIEIVTLDEALTQYSNVLDIETPTGSIVLGNDGTGNLKDYVQYNGLAYEVTIDSPITDYPMGKSLTYFTLSNTNVVGFPTGAGVLETTRPSDDYSFQDFIPYRKDEVWRRRWDNVNKVWTTFLKAPTVEYSHNAPTEAELLSDWTGSFKYSKTVDNVIHLRGTLTAGTVLRNHEVLTIPSLYNSSYTCIDAFNHSKQRKVEFYLTNTGALRLTDVTNIATGDSIRFNSLYRINS